MLAGHFGFAAAVKSRTPAVPLWLLMLATQWLDIWFVPFVVLGLERFEPVDGASPGTYGELLIYAHYTHSLVGALVLCAALGAWAMHRYGKKSGLVVGFAGFSHWLLDVVVHRADMPLLPGARGGLPRLGLGLWRHHAASAMLEILLLSCGAALYWQAARRVAGNDADHIKRAKLCSGAILIAGLCTLGLNLFGM